MTRTARRGSPRACARGKTITFDDDPEEWVRGLAASFRTPYLSADVVEDTNPLPDVEIEPANVKEPIIR